MNGKTQFSICITSFSINRLDLLKNLIDSIEKQKGDYKAELIILIERDKSLYNNIVKYLIEYRFPSTIIFKDKSTGLSVCRNICAKYSTGEILSFLDDDIILNSSWMENTYDFFTSYPDANVLGGMVKPKWIHDEPKYLDEDMYWLLGCSPIINSSEIESITNIIGCNMNIKKNIFNKVGGFNELLGFSLVEGRLIGGEDLDICLKIQDICPNSVYIDPNNLILHQIPDSKFRNNDLIKRGFWYGFGNTIISNSHNYTIANKGYIKTILKYLAKDIVKPRKNILRISILFSIFFGFTYFIFSKFIIRRSF